MLYKLDRGLDHILIDEAQDTSPDQWDIIDALADEFFAGEGARDGRLRRTMFAVGDRKQSIYSFPGRRPEMFDKQRLTYTGARHRRERRVQAGRTSNLVPLGAPPCCRRSTRCSPARTSPKACSRRTVGRGQSHSPAGSKR